LVSSLNPKALIFVSALLPQFIEPALPLIPQVAVLYLTSAVIHFTIYFSYAALTFKAKYLLKSDQIRQRLMKELNNIDRAVLMMYIDGLTAIEMESV